MPKNKADKKENQQNKAEFAEEVTTLKKGKASDYPPSLNRIDKR